MKYQIQKIMNMILKKKKLMMDQMVYLNFKIFLFDFTNHLFTINLVSEYDEYDFVDKGDDDK